MANSLLDLTIIVLIYLALIIYVGYVAWRRTKTADDYMVAGRATHPFIMALSYGATFISTAAIVGFGGEVFHQDAVVEWITSRSEPRQ